VLKRIFGLKKDGVTGGLRKLHNEELCNLYSSSIIRMIKSDEMGGACGTIGIEEKLIYAIGENSRRKENTRKTRT
jgi:hypothetical protein